MNIKLKPLAEQVIAITGATSGIGLVTARMAAERGAAVIAIARNLDALTDLTEELTDKGCRVRAFKADVIDEDQLKAAADEACRVFGRIDTWVNNAGVSIYGRLDEVAMSDSRKLFDTNFWGVVNGSLIAADVMKTHGGGAIINIGSTLSDRAIPIQGMYCASKHAVKGFTDAFRMELEAENAPISVTLVKPSAIDTPYREHAKNYLTVEPQNPPPVYAPETVAEAILHCAENAVRDVFVGAGGKALSAMGNYIPGSTDKVMETFMIDAQMTDQPKNGTSLEGLYRSRDHSLSERGGYEGHVMESSMYTKATLNPWKTGVAVAMGVGAIGLGVFALSKIGELGEEREEAASSVSD